MRRHSEQCKENTRPVGTSSFHQHPILCPDLVRRPLGERKPSNGVGVDVGPCIKWLEGTVALSRATAASKQPSTSVSVATLSPPRSNSNPRAAPAALPSCSPDIIRKKSSSRDLEGCFAVGPTVKGNVKDRRKSKPRALLTVEALPNAATLTFKELKCLPKPGRASLEWLSDDPDSEAADSNTDLSGTCDGSSESSLCCGFVQDLGAYACQDDGVDILKSCCLASTRCSTVGEGLPAKETIMKGEPARVEAMGGYQICLMNSRSISCPLDDPELDDTLMSKQATHLKEGIALQKLTLRKPGDDGVNRIPFSSLNGFNQRGGCDSLIEQVRSLQDELKGCSDHSDA